LILTAILLAGFFSYRWLGTSTLRGHVQRVYEKDAAYKIEFVELSGDVSVVENTPIRFPHFKLETADLQAELHHLSESGDIVDLKVWGPRLSWLDIFPNAIESEFVRSNEERKKEQVERVTNHVVNELIDQGVLTRGEGAEKVRPGLKKAISESLTESRNSARGTVSSGEPKPADD
jgi:hypothetical protein